jgi:hypothetical protein
MCRTVYEKERTEELSNLLDKITYHKLNGKLRYSKKTPFIHFRRLLGSSKLFVSTECAGYNDDMPGISPIVQNKQ